MVAGGCDFYPGSATSSPGFSFSVTDLRVAGEGDLLARIERLRKQLDAEGLLEPPEAARPPAAAAHDRRGHGESGKARDDILAGPRPPRLGRADRVGLRARAGPPRGPAIVRALTDLAAVGGVDVAIVARGGGSLADLLCFCDETLCRTVALLGVPVIASVGHHTDRTLLDDVAAVSCSTPTHAAEAAVGLDCAARAHGAQSRAAARTARARPPRVLSRARMLRTLSRAPAAHLERQRARLHQHLREIRAGSRRRVQAERELTQPARARPRAQGEPRPCATAARRRPQELARLALALAGHDPQRTLERGYALVQSRDGEPLATAAAARATTQGAAALRRRHAPGEDPRAMSEPRSAPEPPASQTSSRRPTRPRRRASRRSSVAWTPARPA